jgi:putative glutamine amidotransferase
MTGTQTQTDPASETDAGSVRVPVIGVVARQDISATWQGYAIYGQGQSYCRAVALAGGAPALIPLDLGIDAWRSIYRRLDGLLLPGGVDLDPALYGEEPHPKLGKVNAPLDEAELVLARWALADGMPLLGVCRGIQTLNVAAGGTLYQDLPSQYASALAHSCSAPDYPRTHRAHAVHVQPDSRLANILSAQETMVNSRHHQAVKDLGAGLIVSARAPDGVIEGIEAAGNRRGENGGFAVGIQWHPESLAADDPQMLALFEALVHAAVARSGDRPQRDERC